MKAFNHFQQGNIINILCRILFLMLLIIGDYVRSEKLYTKLLDQLRKELGEDHPHTLSIMNNLG